MYQRTAAWCFVCGAYCDFCIHFLLLFLDVSRFAFFVRRSGNGFNNKWEADSLKAARCGVSRFQNGSGSGEDAARAMVWDFLFGFQPVLDVATAEFCTVEAKRFAADECHGLCFDLAD